MAYGAVPDADAVALEQLLLDAGLITKQQVGIARAATARTGAPFDEVLVSLGLVSDRVLRSVLARDWGLPVLDLAVTRRDEDYIRQWSGQKFLAQHWMPVRRNDDGTVVVATSRRVTPARRALIAAEVGAAVEFGAVSQWDLRQFALNVYRAEIADEAANGLFRRSPLLSAKTVFSRGQTAGFVLLGLAVAAAAVFWPVQTAGALVTAMSLVFLVGTVFRYVVAVRGARFDMVERVTDADVAELRERALPRYTVLVPLYADGHLVDRLVSNLSRLDYPPEKLEVLFLVEEADTATADAIRAARPPANFRVITIPPGEPQTKPRALNVGLFFATGEYLVIFDAQDSPDRDQLKKAVIAFRRGDARLVCVQASLTNFNSSENTLTRLSTLESSSWFDYVLAGLDALDLPMPLGGTSNHFRTAALVELGGWDPHNMTEDADLGIRAKALGHQVGLINSATEDEAITSVAVFVRQRTRWLKGYMQTALLHARRPRELIAKIGLRRFAAFAVLIGGTPLTFLAVIPLWIASVATLLTPSAELAELFPVGLLWMSFLNFVIGNSALVYLAMMGPYKRGQFDVIFTSLLYPFYVLVLSLAAYRALAQLFTKPHYWEKTQRGVSRVAPDVTSVRTYEVGGL
ncbi:glycosyltransferase [uncultured Schumannella sp.]|uniref:glycosyltransferase n=1 Tax=uncultured Schumannella sp. TaxID=1195956 RepID=UPI0025FDF2AD|nr:glycosyltransferase [uncultured Schumannella sp.]